MGTNAFDLIHPDDVEQVITKFKATLAETNKPKRFNSDSN